MRRKVENKEAAGSRKRKVKIKPVLRVSSTIHGLRKQQNQIQDRRSKKKDFKDTDIKTRRNENPDDISVSNQGIHDYLRRERHTRGRKGIAIIFRHLEGMSVLR